MCETVVFRISRAREHGDTEKQVTFVTEFLNYLK